MGRILSWWRREWSSFILLSCFHCVLFAFDVPVSFSFEHLHCPPATSSILASFLLFRFCMHHTITTY